MPSSVPDVLHEAVLQGTESYIEAELRGPTQNRLTIIIGGNGVIPALFFPDWPGQYTIGLSKIRPMYRLGPLYQCK